MPIDSSADLLNLLSMCEPDNERLEKEAQIETLIATPAYEKLAADARFRTLFDQYYAPDALEKLSLARVRRARSAIPVARHCFEAIAASIRSGPAPTLTRSDFPDFYSASSLQNLARKLSAATEYNYTNIPEEDFMEIFSDMTVRKAKDIFGAFDENSFDYAEQIERVTDGRPYCIDESEVEKLEDEYRAALLRFETSGRDSTHGWLGKRKHRLWVALGVLALTAIIYAIGGLREPEIEISAAMIVGILGAVFIIWG